MTSLQGTQYLLQSEDNLKIHDWYVALTSNAKNQVKSITLMWQTNLIKDIFCPRDNGPVVLHYAYR